MKAMILAAGLGTRLKPITDNKPKALIEIDGTTLLELIIKKLEFYGFSEIVVNVHHFAHLVTEFIRSKQFGSEIIISDETERLLDTGGGILNAQQYLDGDQPFLVHNVDILSDIKLDELYRKQVEGNSLATLAISNRRSSRVLLFDESMQLSGWKNLDKGDRIITRCGRELNPFAFNGIYVIDPAVFKVIEKRGTRSIIDIFLELSKSHLITGVDFSKNMFLDIGKHENLINAEKIIDRFRING